MGVKLREAFASTALAPLPRPQRRRCGVRVTMSQPLDPQLSRRQWIRRIMAASAILSAPQASQGRQVVSGELHALASRLDGTEIAMMAKRPDRASLRDDLLYPDSFLGKWRVVSSLLSVAAPAGPDLFGSTGSFERAKSQIGSPPLTYQARFIRDSRGRCIADREYNIVQIANAAMGQGSVLSVNNANSNINFSEIELLTSGGQLFSVRMETSARLGGWSENDLGLLASETVSQTVRLRLETGRGLQDKYQRKEVETICRYRVARGEEVTDRFGAFQKTLTYLPLNDLRSSYSKGFPIDERTYDVEYTRIPQ